MSFRASESCGETEMASWAGNAVRVAAFVAIWGLNSGLTAVGATAHAGGKTPAADPPVRLYQYATPDGDAYFALALRADVNALPRREIHTHAILVDTSASQAGTFRKRTLDVLNGYLAALGEQDRIRLFAVDL